MGYQERCKVSIHIFSCLQLTPSQIKMKDESNRMVADTTIRLDKATDDLEAVVVRHVFLLIARFTITN